MKAICLADLERLYTEAELLLAPFAGDAALRSRQIANLVTDSRKAEQSSVFFALPSASGSLPSGLPFAADAASRGALAVIAEQACPQGVDVPWIQVSNANRALGIAAAEAYGHPSQELCLIGVTGTNGKTTTTWILAEALRLLGKGVVRIGTLGAEISARRAREQLGLVHTTPQPQELHALLRKGREKGAEYALMECSSHALALSRLEELAFDAVSFSNLTPDHLDFHKDFEDYFSAKRHLFELFAANADASGKSVIWTDDEYGARLLESYSHSLTVSAQSDSQFQLEVLSSDLEGLRLKLRCSGKEHELQSQFIGGFNAENIAVAAALLESVGITVEEFARVLPEIQPVPGRLEWRRGSSGVTAVVDYCHTPDALEKCLAVLRPLTEKKLHVVFGCGGDRDRAKRPIMMEAASKGADVSVATNDNPRTEDPQQIIDDMLKAGLRPNRIELDRAAAIAETIQSAEPGDIVLIAGKGHEDYQILGEEKIFFSDIEEVEKALG